MVGVACWCPVESRQAGCGLSVGSLNQARTAVCQRYTNMQSPSLFSAPSFPESSWLESREMDPGCGCRVPYL